MSEDLFIPCARVEEIPEGTVKAVHVAGRAIALVNSEGRIYAVDNRCPHMGYPLSEGTLTNGILICDWHHARFDVASGCTFDPWADDVERFPVQVRDGQVYVCVQSDGEARVAHWKKRLREGLEQNLGLIIAKAVIALRALGVPAEEIVRIGVLYGTANRRAGWGPGLTILTAMANILDRLEDEDQFLALYQGLVHVARDTANSAPRIRMEPLETTEHSFERLKEWFRYFIEVRNADGAERILLTAIRNGATVQQVAEMMTAAATDHFYRDGGHTIDFINKAFEALDHLGWEAAEEVLPTLVRGLANSSRAEESNRWRSPIDLRTLLEKTFETLPELVAEGEGRRWPPEAASALTEVLLGDDAHRIVEELKSAIRHGATVAQLTQTLAYAAALRIARFHTKNELGDWIAVLHTFTAANALHQCAKRSPSVELLRGVFHGAMAVYFDRWFNKPAARLPQHRRETNALPTDPEVLLTELLKLNDVYNAADQAGMLAYRYLSLGHPRDALQKALGHMLLIEDADFHTFQMLEAALALAEELDEERARMVLVAAARYLAAHAPTMRGLRQTATLALRLHRGEQLSAEDPDEQLE
ncbi:MAG: hypothetical protein KatS3mg115_0668 [Candidatus Poribacteria bacterium]|nr:MAG: hypothetical protein KatS3mg115_0668 [Candidatus Poribacteria bacterium]